ncbi:MAG: alpha-glucan family phosphorylase [Bacteroidota bacterium]
MNETLLKPDYIFEVSWEVCNKVGGIYTVVSSKVPSLINDLHDNLILIGPDIWKDTDHNPEFTEDPFLFRSWREYAESKGFRFKIGRWNIAGNPVAILIDFTPFIAQKDQIFARFWEKYKLDSLSGQWDYVEPCLFGYAAACLIENFCDFVSSPRDHIIAQFHEWMCGAGILYLNDNVPRIATSFTTHATVLGRCIAGNGLPLYENMELFKPSEMATQFHVQAKQSLEKISAEVADSFSTVSEVTARECKCFLEKPVDIVTPNGFADDFVPQGDAFEKCQSTARKKLLDVARAFLNQEIPDDTLLIGTSGRYEFRNKGIDVLIDALGKFHRESHSDRKAIAFILVPAGNYGPRKELIDRIGKPDYQFPLTHEYLTHRIHEKEYDPVIKRLEENQIFNLPEDKLKVIFVPSYLNGNDGIFNLPYYDILAGLDLTIFASYYEPWGYTPLESLAFHVPTITTSLAGFGQWIKSSVSLPQDGAAVIERGDKNDAEVRDEILKLLHKFISFNAQEQKSAKDSAFEISRIALWQNLVQYYLKAYSIALKKAEGRAGTAVRKVSTEVPFTKPVSQNKPILRRVSIKTEIPDKLESLLELANNLWWTWNIDAKELFESINHELFHKCNRNPLILLNSLSFDDYKQLEKEEGFICRLELVYQRFKKYLAEKPSEDLPKIAYFSMEYGFHDTMKLFSGGLGILAGDYLKEASDSNVNMIGVGLLYRYGYFTQKLTPGGDQLSIYDPQSFSKMPMHPVRDENGNWKTIQLSFPGRSLYARIWRVDVGRIPLYLMDTDIYQNAPQDREVTHQLYGGNLENRLKQELLLGVGGIRMLNDLNIKPNLYHCNEGHAAFIGIERLHNIIQNENRTFSEAIEIVRSTSLFTTHTPVPAGHDSFSEDLLRTYIPHYADRLNISWTEFMNLGRMYAGNNSEKFSMSYLAAHLSQEINGVSRIHGDVSREILNGLWEGYFPEELHVSYVTNGVHYPTWTSRRWRQFYEKRFGEKFLDDHANPEPWKKIETVPHAHIWDIRCEQKTEMIEYLRMRLSESLTQRQEPPQKIIEQIGLLNDKALIIGFARRFATYKRAYLLFRNLDRLAKIVNNPDKPVQFVFAGKAHPADKAGQDVIKNIIEITRRPEFFGKVFFIENYDMMLAKKMVHGVDIWLNNPIRPLEASGTSGQKAALNGVMHMSVLDGWWAEGYIPGAGWALKQETTYQNADYQDELDAVTIYNIIENEVLPLYFDRDADGVSKGWVDAIRKSIAEIAPVFTSRRMINDYIAKYYSKLYDRLKLISKNDFEVVRDLAAWKKKVTRGWESIEVVAVNVPDTSHTPLRFGDTFEAQLILDVNELSVTDIGVEIVFIETLAEKPHITYKEELKVSDIHGKKITYTVKIPSNKAGILNYGFRIFPRHEMLPHRQDFNLVRWV